MASGNSATLKHCHYLYLKSNKYFLNMSNSIYCYLHNQIKAIRYIDDIESMGMPAR